MRARFLTASALGFGSILQALALLRGVRVLATPAGRAVAAAVGGDVGAALFFPKAAEAHAGTLDLAATSFALAGAAAPTRLAPSARQPAAASCPAGMALVEGNYCPEVRQNCARWLESSGRYAFYRCAEYASATCLSKAREHKHFCIDRDEYMPPGESLPASHQSWTDATAVCASQGKRVCLESEYNFSCEGEEMRPYPYGWKRDASACNADRVDIYQPNGKLRDLRAGPTDNPRCVSPFGVHNLSGNLEEWTTIDGSATKPAMKGAYWQPSRNNCRAAQTAHDRFYKGTETGFRCCADTP